MPGSDPARPERVQPSSLESFLDDYQLVRLVVSASGLVSLLVLGISVGYEYLLPYLVGLTVTGTHAAWSRVRNVRAVKSLLAIDTTVWGAIILITNDPVTGTAMLALLLALVVAFVDGPMRILFILNSLAWYAVSFFDREGLSVGSLGRLIGVVLITGALAAIMARIRTGLGRLEANRSQLLGTVSHELRNNLTGLMGLTEIVSTDRSLGRDEATELVALAHQQAVDAAEIVEDLLTATRLEGSALSVGSEAVDVNTEIESMMRRFSSEGLLLEAVSRNDLPPADADALRLRQILRNLVSNAVRYGGTSIRILTDLDGDRIHITVADDGDGVPTQDETTIFLPYRRSASPRHASSVGLGLWISRALAQAMGGSLEYGRLDGWTHFTLTVPVRTAHASSGAHRTTTRGIRWRRVASKAKAPAGGHRRI
ncbi:MAG: HAMP domain-containing sensor histidine kinase [Acidimicrobiia bacterium]